MMYHATHYEIESKAAKDSPMVFMYLICQGAIVYRDKISKMLHEYKRLDETVVSLSYSFFSWHFAILGLGVRLSFSVV